MTHRILPALALFWLPETAHACEKCFGAAADSPVVYAIGISMLTLLVMIIGVWGGLLSFFRNMEKRRRMLASGELVVTETGAVVPATLVPGAGALDSLLEKINRHGYGSLTDVERTRLHELSTPEA